MGFALENVSTGSSSGAEFWRSVPTGFAFEDGERLLGHVIEAGGQWLAFDATHLNSIGSGFRYVGLYESDAMAKRAVEQSLALTAPMAAAAGIN